MQKSLPVLQADNLISLVPDLVFFILIVSVIVMAFLSYRNTWKNRITELSRELDSTLFQGRSVLQGKLPPFEHERLLHQHFRFYRHLTHHEREEFNRRVTLFSGSRHFEGRQGVEVGKNMKALISASPVMLTFGMKDFMLPHFRLIIIYPEAFLNQFSRNLHKGETNSAGVVVLSWEAYYEGISISNDGINLGLHEFAHSLAILTEKKLLRNEAFIRSFERLMESVSNPRFRLMISERAGLRPYATENPMEFFAVATEVFFEKPEELRYNHPTIYQLFSEMYNLDLASIYARPATQIESI